MEMGRENWGRVHINITSYYETLCFMTTKSGDKEANIKIQWQLKKLRRR